jgi:sortase A
MNRPDLCRDCASQHFLRPGCTWPARRCTTPRRPRSGNWRTRIASAATLLVLAFALWQLGQAAWIQGKAVVAQFLIRAAWAETGPERTAVRPWPWADTWPVARLSAPGRGVELYVLAGADDRTLAFGPGHVFGTPRPGSPGNSVVGAHRDTHFAFLQRLENGDELIVETPDRRRLHYRVAHTEVVDKDDLAVLAQPPSGTRLTLVTCYPFKAVEPGGPLRYAVFAEALDSAQTHGALAVHVAAGIR